MNTTQATTTAAECAGGNQHPDTAPYTASSERIIWRRWYAGFLNGEQLTAWDKRRDKVYSTTRRMMRERRLPSSQATWEIRSRCFMQKVAI
jgi:hypothetical protein